VVDDVVADLGQAVNVGLTGAEVAALDGVVEEPPDAVAVVGVVFGGVDAALGGDAVGPPRAVLKAEGFVTTRVETAYLELLTDRFW
jgi:hypothetical protein